MSFSQEVKEELEKKIDTARHCQIAEFAAFMGMCGSIYEENDGELSISFIAENELVLSKFFTLLGKLFDIKSDDANVISEEKSGQGTLVKISDKRCVADILMLLKWTDDIFSSIDSVFVDERLVQKDCCKKAFIRGAFLTSGSVSDPNRYYHYEIVCSFEEDAEKLRDMLCFFGLDAKITSRKNSFVVYIKESNNIADALNLMGAVKCQMNLFNVIVIKDMRNRVNRKVNCEAANLNKTVSASVKQTNDILTIRDTIGLDRLNDNLREIAYLRLENQDISLKELGEMLDPPVGKSGVNHRLRKISEIAEELRGS